MLNAHVLSAWYQLKQKEIHSRHQGRLAFVDKFRDAICPCSNWPSMQIEGGIGLGDVLPFTSLRHIKELELDSFYEQSYVHPSWQQWPMAWSRLTALTSLSCRLFPYDIPHIPSVLKQMTSLRSLEVSQTFSNTLEVFLDIPGHREEVEKAAEQQMLENTTNLTRLTSLLIDGAPFVSGP